MKIIDEELIDRILLGVIMILSIAILFVVIFKDDECEVISSSNDVKSIVKEDIVEEKIVDTKISVDIKGAVKKEGVYELDYGSRVDDAIKAAGGLKSGANTKYLNMSKRIKDETVINVYTDKQVKSMLEKEETKVVIKEECVCPEQEIIDCIGSTIVETNKDDSSTSSSTSNDDNEVKENVESNSNGVESETQIDNSSNKISLNKASKEELMTLKGIGEAKANAIIEYRKTNNGFKNIEEIMNVSGIGEAAFNKIKDFITL